MPPERPGIDILPSLVVLSLATNIVTTALTMMRPSTPVRTGVRSAAGSWKLKVIGSSLDRRLAGGVEGAGSTLSTL